MKKVILAFAAFSTTFSLIACGDDSSSVSATSIESSSSESYENLDGSSSSTKDPKPTEKSSSSDASSSSIASSSSVGSSSSVVESSSSTPIENPVDKSDDLLSCDQKFERTVFDSTFTRHFCAEAVNTAEYRERLDVICAPSKDSTETLVKGTGCPGDAKVVCEGQKEGTFMYFYDEEDAHKSCEKLMARFADSGEKDSSSVSDDLLACEFKYDFTVNGDPFASHNCVKVPLKYKKTLDNVCNSFERTEGIMIGSQTAIKMASCPEGAKKVCESEGQVWYYYEEDAAQKTCEELLGY